MTLTAVDYLVIAGYLVAITAFGSYFAKFQKTTRDYFLTGRSVPWWGICFTIVATETSTLSFIGVPATAFAGNMTFLELAMGYVIGRMFIAAVFIPAYFRGDLFTSYELLQRRFGTSVKTVAAGLFLGTRTFADGIRLFATALVIAIVTGVPVGWSVVLLGVAMIIYTVRGGASAVIWTDVIQMFVYLAGAFVAAWALLHRIPGGWHEVITAGQAAGKFTIFNLSWNVHTAYTLWAGILGGVSLTLATHGTDQYLVQRLLSARSSRDAGLGLVLSGFLVFAQFFLFLLIGVMLFTYYQHVPLPPLGRNDELLPRFIIDTLHGGVAGFVVAAIVAAALSPSLNAMAATTVNDFYKRYVRVEPDEAALLRISKIATIGWGVAQIVVALLCQWMNRGVLDAGLSVLSLTSGPVLGAFLVGVLSRRAKPGPMLTGMIVGIITLMFVWWFDAVAWPWYAFIGVVITSAVALAGSWLGPKETGT